MDKRSDKPGADFKKLRFRTLLVAGVWTFSVAASLAWNIYQDHVHTQSIVKNEARAIFNKDQAFRLWATAHGGVYVPITAETPPNPYLSHIADRDIQLPSGRKLTLMNPAYMLRQMMQQYSEEYGIKGHITSLNLLNPDNVPDEWERRALLSFERGGKEVFEFSDIDGTPYIRLMKPMVVQKGCLKCHGYQQYKEGDIRGGVGVSVPIEPYLALERKDDIIIALSHAVIMLFGWVGIGYFFFKEKGRLVERLKSEEALNRAHRQNEMILNSAGEGICGLDANGDVTFANVSAVKMLGWEVDELVGRNSHATWHYKNADETPLPSAECPLEAALKSGVGSYVDDAVFWRKDGASFPVEYTVTPILQDHIVTGAVVTFRDITERKLADAEIAKRVEDLESFFKATVGRELRIIELKDEIKMLKKALARHATGE